MKRSSGNSKIAAWAAPLTLAHWLPIGLIAALYAYLGPKLPYIPRHATFGVGLAIGLLAGVVFMLVCAVADIALLALFKRALPAGQRGWLLNAAGAALFMLSYFVVKPWLSWRLGPWVVLSGFAAPPVVTALATRILNLIRPA
jgi:hypothetical protein